MKKLIMTTCLLILSFSIWAEVETTRARFFTGYVNPKHYVTALVGQNSGEIMYFSKVYTGHKHLDKSCYYDIKFNSETLFEIHDTGDCGHKFYDK